MLSHPARFRMAALTAALLVLAFAAEIATRAGGDRTVLWIDDAGTLIAALAATASCAVAAWRGDCRDRVGWALLAGGLASWSFGEGAWGTYELGSRGSVPFPSVADAGYLLAVPLIAAGLLAFPSGGRLMARTRSLLDGLIVAASLLVVSWVTVLGSVYHAGGGGPIDQAITLAYPVGDVVTGTIVLTVLARSRWRRGNPLVLLGLALVVMALSDSIYAWLVQANAYQTGSAVDIGWVAAYLVLALAALRPEGTLGAERRMVLPSPEVSIPLTTIILPYGVLSVAFGVWIGAVVTGANDDRVLLSAGGVLTALVVLRQLVTLLDNRRLNADLLAKVSELGERERDLEHLAFHDPLTGLPNRALFLLRVQRAIQVRATHPAPVAVIFIDLDDFKTVNDSLGHEAGDQLLVQVAERIGRCVRGGDTAARLGGDEFGIVISDLEDSTHGPALFASRILETMRRPFVLVGREVAVRASIGITYSLTGHEEPAELLRQADTAMYAAKGRGKGCYELFEPRMGADAQRRLELQGSLARALSTDQLRLHYQPVIDLGTGRIQGAEALARWDHPELGPIPPAVFVAVAEESGLIYDLGRWALLRACEEAARWPSDTVVSVNLSAAQLYDSAIVETVTEALHVAGIPAERLMLEITESVIMRHTERTMAQLRSLRSLGVRLAIDDFGTGYSSLSYLPQFPVDVIKVDQSFVREIADGSGLAIVRAIVDLASRLGLRTIAEGIETESQALILRSVGCTSGQGYWFSRPVPPDGLRWTSVTLPRREAHVLEP